MMHFLRIVDDAYTAKEAFYRVLYAAICLHECGYLPSRMRLGKIIGQGRMTRTFRPTDNNMMRRFEYGEFIPGARGGLNFPLNVCSKTVVLLDTRVSLGLLPSLFWQDAHLYICYCSNPTGLIYATHYPTCPFMWNLICIHGSMAISLPPDSVNGSRRYLHALFRPFNVLLRLRWRT